MIKKVISATICCMLFISQMTAQTVLANFDNVLDESALSIQTGDGNTACSISVADNPDKTGINTTNKCMYFKQDNDQTDWSRAIITLAETAQITNENRYLHIMVYMDVAQTDCGLSSDMTNYSWLGDLGASRIKPSAKNKWVDFVYDMKGNSQLSAITSFRYIAFSEWGIRTANMYFDEIELNNDPDPRGTTIISTAATVADFEDGGTGANASDTGNACQSIEVTANPDKSGLNTTEKALHIHTNTTGEWWGGADITFENQHKITDENCYLHIMTKSNASSMQYLFYAGSEQWPGAFSINKSGWFDKVIDLSGFKGQTLTGIRAVVEVDKANNQDKDLYIDEIILNNDPQPRVVDQSEEELKLQFTFEDVEGSIVKPAVGSYNATLENNASIVDIGAYKILDLGSENGYLDLGSDMGDLIAQMYNFTIASYVYVDTKTDLTVNGNFIFTFSNSTDIANDPVGCIFLSAMKQRYAISTTNWGGEQGVEVGSPLEKGVWKHVAYVQNGTTGTLYIDGQAVNSGTISIYPSDLGTTTYNFIGRSPYVGDAYLKNSLLTDIRIYNMVLDADGIAGLAADREAIEDAYTDYILNRAKENLSINGGETIVRESFELPTSYDGGVQISWTSDQPDYISNTGKVTRPENRQQAVEVMLTATFSRNGKTVTKTYTLQVQPYLSDEESVERDLSDLQAAWSEKCIREQVELPTNGIEGSVITWKSNNPDFITDDGKVLKLAPKGQGNKTVTLTATFQKGESSMSHDFSVCILEDEGYSAYLFVYFIGNNGDEEALRFALSRDGYHYNALNGNNPVIASDTISLTGGIRDPHILRGEDGNFYMALTDMQACPNGNCDWNGNHGIILLKSADLINWTHSAIDIKDKYPDKFGSIQSAWAPQTIYDPDAGKYMVYWSMRSPGVHEIIYYAYANSDFTDLEGEPQILFNHPDAKSTIDGDIILKDGQYHLFFKTEGDGNGIKKAVSDKLTSGYVIQDKYLQQTTESVEGACVFRLTNSDTYILMYDVYNNGRYEFTESTDLENFTKIDDSKISMDFHPRHGTVIPITEEESERLLDKWGTESMLDIVGSESSAVRTRNLIKEGTEIFLPVVYGTDLTSFDPELLVLPGITVNPTGAQDFSSQPITYTLQLDGATKDFKVTAQVNANPVLDGYYADPEILYSKKNNKYYIYPTTDGTEGWASTSFKTFSSSDLIHWKDEGEILVLGEDVEWAARNAWAPCIIEKETGNNEYKYYYYFTAAQQIGVAVADDPAGPFKDSGQALINSKPAGVTGGQEIDPDVFCDPVSGKNYLYWGNGYLAVAELNDDMVSIKSGSMQAITVDNTFREGVYVFYRQGKYYFFWSEDDTGSENYKVRYATASSPLGPLSIPSNNIVIQKDTEAEIYGTGHCSVLQIPDTDEWYIVYHRFGRPRIDPSGYRREVCIDKLEFNADGSIKATTPTLEGITESKQIATSMPDIASAENTLHLIPNPASDLLKLSGITTGKLTIYDSMGRKVYEHDHFTEQDAVNIQTWASGVYFVQIHNNGLGQSGILIKE